VGWLVVALEFLAVNTPEPVCFAYNYFLSKQFHINKKLQTLSGFTRSVIRSQHLCGFATVYYQ
jgi:hypothetical protein